ncbi:hypothetical protein HBB16_16120 [Pseudonocardia sp. MCCB 268]|nr:hypothetical protein [Pseudonocardia cytotoxica]
MALTTAYDPDVVAAPQGSGWDPPASSRECARAAPRSRARYRPPRVHRITQAGPLPASAVQANAESIADYLDVRDRSGAGDAAAALLLRPVGGSALRTQLRGRAGPAGCAGDRARVLGHRPRVMGDELRIGCRTRSDQLDALGWPPPPSPRYVTQAGGRLIRNGPHGTRRGRRGLAVVRDVRL